MYNTLSTVKNEIEEIISIYTTAHSYSSVYGISMDDATDLTKEFTENKLKAQKGSAKQRNYVIQQLTIALTKLQGKTTYDVDKIVQTVDFKNLSNNEASINFALLLKIHEIDYYLDELHNRKVGDERYIFTENDLHFFIGKEEASVLSHFDNIDVQRAFVAELIFSFRYGKNSLDMLTTHVSSQEIGFNRSDYIYTIYKRDKYLLEFLSIGSTSIAENIMKLTTDKGNTDTYSEAYPYKFVSSIDGNRITVAGHSVTPTNEHKYYNERFLNLKQIPLAALKGQYKTIDDKCYELIKANQKGRGSYLVAGGDTNVGKSTFFVATIEETPQNWGIAIIDFTNEASADVKYPKKNIQPLIITEKYDADELVSLALKQARDIVMVQEITRPVHVSALLDISDALDAGIGGTIHSRTPNQVISRMAKLAVKSNVYKELEKAEEDLADAFDIVYFLEEHMHEKGRIILKSISEVVSIEQNRYFEIETEDEEAMDRNLKLMQQHQLFKSLYKKPYIIKPIIEYSYDTDTWEVANDLSDKYYDKISYHTDVSRLKEVLKGVPK